MKFKNVLFYCIAAIVIFSPIARGAVRLWSITPVLAAIYSLVFIWLWRLNNEKNGTIIFKKIQLLDAVIFSFMAMSFISCFFSVNKYDSFYFFLRLLAFTGFYYLVLKNFDAVLKDRLLGLIVGLGALLSLYGLLQYFGKLNHFWWFPPEFLSATYVNHNHFAGFLELVIPTTIAMLISCPHERFYHRLGLGAITAILLITFIFTQSRGGWVALAISLLVLSFALNKKIFIIVLISAVIAGSLYIQKESLHKRVKETEAFAQGQEETSIETRLLIWKATLRMIQDNPFIGVGLGAFDSAFYRYRPQGLNTRAVYAHNDYMQMASEMGLLAPILMAWGLFLIIRRGLKSQNTAILGCSIGILSLSLHSLADFNFHIPANMLLLTLYAALIISSEEQKTI